MGLVTYTQNTLDRKVLEQQQVFGSPQPWESGLCLLSSGSGVRIPGGSPKIGKHFLGLPIFTYSLFTRYQTHCLFPYFWERQWVFIMSRQRILSGTRKAVEKTANPMQPVNCSSNSYVVDANRKLLYWTLWKDSGFPWIFRAGMIAKQILITQMWDSHNLFMGVVYPFIHYPIWNR